MNIGLTYAYIATTNHCNLNCSFCNRIETVKELQHMSLSNFIKIMEQLKDNPINEVKLIGLGETFFHPQFYKICEILKSYFPNSKLISSTNCQYQISENLKESLKYLDVLYLSIDGYEKTYEKFRGNASWEILINFLEELKTLNRYNCKAVINYVVNPDNIDDIQTVYDKILIPYGLEKLRLNLAQNWSEDGHIIKEYTTTQIEYLKTNWRNNIKGKAVWDYSDCFWVKTGVYITVDGNLKVCPMNTTSNPIGNVFKNSINDLRNSEKYQLIKTGCETDTPTKHCETCSYKELVPLLQKIKND